MRLLEKLIFILADGPSPMTIASSVMSSMFGTSIARRFSSIAYVGCVPPEADVWEKLRQVDQLEDSIVTFTIPDSNLAKVKKSHESYPQFNEL